MGNFLMRQYQDENIIYIDRGISHKATLNDLHYKPMPAIFDTYNGKFLLKYGARKTFTTINEEIPITQIENITISRYETDQANALQDESKTLTIDEDLIIITIQDNQNGYFHLIYNILAEVEIIKSYFPNSKIKILQMSEDGVFDFFLERLESKEVLKAYGISKEDIIDFSKFDFIKMRSIIFIYSQYNYLASQVASHNFDYSGDRKEKQSLWGKMFIKQIRERFLVNDVKSSNKKIFLSGMESNKGKRSIAEILRKRVYGYEISQEEYDKVCDIKPSDYASFVDRLMTKEDELRLEEAFKKAGYLVVDPEEYESIYDQASLFAAADVLVGLAGASFVNSCFSGPDTKILLLNSSDSYRFPHQDVISSFGLKSDITPKQKLWKDSVYSSKDIISSVKSGFPEFLE
jgi:hypothetical protein